MSIRQTRTNNKTAGHGYFTLRLVRGERIGGRVRQITILKLGRNFAVKVDDGPVLCSRIEKLLSIYRALGITVAAENRSAERPKTQIRQRKKTLPR